MKSDSLEYYEYVLLYTENVILISENSGYVLREQIGKYFDLKEDSIGIPDIYIGGRLCKVQLENRVKGWEVGST